jgi:hypothetical protein
MGRPLWGCTLQLLLVLARAVFLGSESGGTHSSISFYQFWDYPDLENEVLVFISSRNRAAQLCPQAQVWVGNQVKGKVKVTLWSTISRPVCPVIRLSLGTRDQFVFHFYGIYFQTFLFLLVRHHPWREDGSVMYSYWPLPVLSLLDPNPNILLLRVCPLWLSRKQLHSNGLVCRAIY